MTALRDCGLEARAYTPTMLRDLVAQGWSEIQLTMTAECARRMADDLEFAIKAKPLGRPLEDYAFVEGASNEPS